MGSCVSTHLRKSPAPAATVADIPSPVKETAVNGGVIVLEPQFSVSKSNTAFRDYGSKDDVFFDSRAWLDSDCEDDFFSVNGDFTPSRGNTPLHSSFMSKTGRITAVSIPEPSPNRKKKKLAELFRDSIGSQEEPEPDPAGADDNDEFKSKAASSPDKKSFEPPNPTIEGVVPGSEANSVCSTEPASSGLEPDRTMQHGCLPSLRSCRGRISVHD